MGEAAIINLHYDPNMSMLGRTEHSVVYVSKDWNELIGTLDKPGLLVKPNEFFRNKRNKFQPPAPAGIDPAAGYGGPNPGKSIKPFEFSTGPTIFLNSLRVRIIEGMRILPLLSADFHIEKSLTKYLDHLKSYFEGKGGFVAEFALDTGVLSVLYYPPTAPNNWPIKGATGPQPSGLTPVTLAMIKGRGVGHIHFDLIDANDFVPIVLNYIENPGSLATRITPRKRLLKTSATLVAEGGTLDYDNPLPLRDAPLPQPDPTITFTPQADSAGVPYDPSVVIDGNLYEGTMGPPCSVVSVYENPLDSGNFVLTTLEVKEY